MTARQALTRQDYGALSYFGEKVDTDTRVRLCSHALVNMLRHARGLGDTVELAPDGTMPVQEILRKKGVQDSPDAHVGYRGGSARE